MNYYYVKWLSLWWWENCWWQTDAPSLLAISMATAVLQGNTDGTIQCGMYRATLEATVCCHQVTTCSVLPWRLPGQQANKQQSTYTPTLLAISMAMAMHRYNTACIAWWRRSRASLEPTGRCHLASFMSDNLKGTWLHWVFWMFFIIKTKEKGRRSTLGPLFSMGVLHIKRKRRA